MAPPTRRTFPPLITASSWDGVWAACFDSALRSHGKAHASDGTLVPPLTNAEAVQLIFAWRGAGEVPLWGQYAAVAYGWTPDNGMLDVSKKQASKDYPVQIGGELWLSLQSLALGLDGKKVPSPRLDFSATFDDSTTQAAVAADLKADGADVKFAQGGSVAPITKPKPKPKPTPLWLTAAWVYFGYRVLKNLTGGDRYTG